jgi:DNA anti-recombination protein RmuC
MKHADLGKQVLTTVAVASISFPLIEYLPWFATVLLGIVAFFIRGWYDRVNKHIDDTDKNMADLYARIATINTTTEHVNQHIDSLHQDIRMVLTLLEQRND